MKIDPQMIEEIVREILNRLGSQPALAITASNPNLVVVNAPDEKTIGQLKRNWNVHCDPSNLSDLPTDFEEVVFFQASQSLIVKGAVGLADDPESVLLANLLLSGKSITLIPSVELEWLLEEDRNWVPESAYRQHLFTYKEKLTSFGVSVQSHAHFLHLSEQMESLSTHFTFREKLLTEKSVKDSHGNKILIHKSTIVTPLARDVARNLGKMITIVE
jgi:hypothetical protein